MNDIIRIAIEVSVQSTALALCVGAILAAARIRSGAVRHAAWLAVLCGMMLMPLFSRVTPQVTVPITLPALVNLDAPVTNGAVQLPQGGASAAEGLTLPRQPVSERVPWFAIGMAIYGSGVLFFLTSLIPGWRVARQIGRSCVAVTVPITGASVCESTFVHTPLTVGILSPRIVLPLAWREWTGTKLQAVLAHEAAHVRYRDGLVNFAAWLNRCIFWFHPLAWWLEKKLALTAEYACDEAAARAVGDSREYAHVLLDVAAVMGSQGRRYAFVSAGMRGDGGLEGRIDRILREDAVRVVSPARKAMVAVACTVAVVAIAACRQAAAPQGEKAHAPMPEVQALLTTRENPTDAGFQSQLATVREKLEQSNDVELLATNGQALVNRFAPGPLRGGEVNATGQAAIARALKLDPASRAAREAQVSAEKSVLMSVRWNPADTAAQKRLAYVAGELEQSTDVNFLIATATPMVSMSWPTTQGFAAGGELFATGKAAVERALKLSPDSVWARQLMLKVRDQEQVASLPQDIWSGPMDSRHKAIQALPAGERFREMSILAASAGDNAMRAKHDHTDANALWKNAGDYAKEALGMLKMAPQAQGDPDYGTSLFRADMVAGAAALAGGDKAAGVAFAQQAMKAPATEALQYPIVNARPWTNWHYPQILVVQLLREGDREAAAEIAERYSQMMIADKELWVADAATIRKGGMPVWERWY